MKFAVTNPLRYALACVSLRESVNWINLCKKRGHLEENIMILALNTSR